MKKLSTTKNLALSSAALSLAIALSAGCDNDSEAPKENQVQTSRAQTTRVISSKKPKAVKPTIKVQKDTAPKKPCQAEKVNLRGVKIIPREDWGAKPPNLEVLESMPNCANFPIQKITIHNTGEGSETTPGQEKMRLISAQLAHTDPRFKKNWGDIAYHYAVGLSGQIYEGRNPGFRGDSGTKYYPHDKKHSHLPEHHLLIAVIGNYDLQKLTAKTRRSLTKLIAANLKQYGLSPNAVVTHKDLAYTSCPGEDLTKWLKGNGKYSIRARHKQLLPK